jgi:hypothetical protein
VEVTKLPELMFFMAIANKTGEVDIDGVKYLLVATTNDGNVFQMPMRHRAALQGQGFIEVANPGV